MDTSGRQAYARTVGGSLVDSLFAVLLLFLVQLPGANAQTSPANISRTGTESAGAIVPLATVMLVHTDTNDISTFQTDEIRALFVEMAKHNFALISLQGGKL
jgi:hypothetical protein